MPEANMAMNRNMTPTPESSAGASQQYKMYSDIPMDTYGPDIEQKPLEDTHLMNSTVRSFTWSNVTVTVKDVKTKLPKAILTSASGAIEAGKCCTHARYLLVTYFSIR